MYRNFTQGVFVLLMPIFYFLLFGWGNQSSKEFFVYLIPSAILFIIITTMVVNQANNIVLQRDRLLLKRMYGTPLTAFSIISSKVFVSILILVVQTLAIFLLSIYVFGVKIELNIPLFITVFLISCLFFGLFGFAVANLIPNADSALAVSQVILLAIMLLAIPSSFEVSFGSFLNTISDYNPATFFLEAMYTSFSDDSLKLQWFNLTIVIVWFLLVSFIGIKKFRWSDK